jgi:hypothetical protein
MTPVPASAFGSTCPTVRPVFGDRRLVSKSPEGSWKLLTGALTVWFNLQHAGSDPGRRLAAALPPVLMMLAFEIDIQIVKWVMTALGKPLGPLTPPPGAGMLPSDGRT